MSRDEDFKASRTTGIRKGSDVSLRWEFSNRNSDWEHSSAEILGCLQIAPSFFRQNTYQLRVRNKKQHVAGVIAGQPKAARVALSAVSGKDIHQTHNPAGLTEKRLLITRSKEDEGRRHAGDDGLLISEAAARLRCDRSTIYRLVRIGVLWGWSISANPNSCDGQLRIASEAIDAYKRRYLRGGYSADLSTPGSGSGNGWARPARRRADALGKKYRESILYLDSTGITFKSRKASE